MKVELTFDARGWDEFVRAWQEPAVKRTLQAGASAFGKAAKPVIASEIPIARPGNPYAQGPGNLRRLVRYKRFSSLRGIGVVIGPMGRNAFYRRFVAGGTKPHVILPKRVGGRLAFGGGFARIVHHPGAKANDFIGRASGRAIDAGYRASEVVVFDGLEGQRVIETFDS